jgi:hypothetical protein
MISNAVCMLQEDQDEVVYQEWRPIQGMRRDRVDHPSAGGERLDVLEDLHDGVMPCTRVLLVWLIKPSKCVFSVWASKPS